MSVAKLAAKCRVALGTEVFRLHGQGEASIFQITETCFLGERSLRCILKPARGTFSQEMKQPRCFGMPVARPVSFLTVFARTDRSGPAAPRHVAGTSCDGPVASRGFEHV